MLLINIDLVKSFQQSPNDASISTGILTNEIGLHHSKKILTHRHTFLGLHIQERTLDLYGRNHGNTLAIRAKDSKESWDLILEIAHRIREKWSKDTKLGEGARYIIKNFEKLTYYLKDPRLSPNNKQAQKELSPNA